jgi:predicted translin family RNA/ssDNA-binding protein
MNRDVKEVVGTMMRILGGGDVSLDQLEELSFEADGELQRALNEAYIKLMEFAYDRELRLGDQTLDRKMRSALQKYLDQIVAAWDQQSRMASQDSSI